MTKPEYLPHPSRRAPVLTLTGTANAAAATRGVDTVAHLGSGELAILLHCGRSARDALHRRSSLPATSCWRCERPIVDV